MYTGKVMICGVNTSHLTVLSDEEKRRLLLLTKEGDKNARRELIYGNLRLVLSVLQRFSSRREDADDLFQVGCIGLMKAIDNFNTELSVKFSTYAVPMIIGEIRRYLRDNNSIRVSRSVRDLAYRALSVREEITRKTGAEPSVDAIASALGEEKKAVAAAMEAIVEPVSLYDSVYSDGEDSVYVIDQVKATEDTDENWVESLSLRDAYSHLTEREKKIIGMRFYNGKTQMEIAGMIGISQAQVSRLEKSALAKMRSEM